MVDALQPDVDLPHGSTAPRETLFRLLSAAMSAMLDPSYTVQWKGADGVIVTLTAEQIIAEAQAVCAHVQACFDREAELLADLE